MKILKFIKHLPIYRVQLAINEQEISENRRGISVDDQIHTGNERNIETQANVPCCDIYTCETIRVSLKHRSQRRKYNKKKIILKDSLYGFD
jgi:hypothetical protein